jgi:trans-aconitate methyltransferase
MLIPIDSNGFWANRSTPAESLEKTAGIFNRIRGETIVEIGSGLQGELNGNSILVWAQKTTAKRIITVDTDQKMIDQVMDATSQYPNVETVVGDGIQYLQQFRSKIDLLYLDFWSDEVEHGLPGTGRAEAHRKAYSAARDKLNSRSMILIDDTDHIDPWKHTYIVTDARKDGFVVLYVGRQTLLARNLT